MLLTVAVVVFEVVAVILEDVEAFILHLPTAAPVGSALSDNRKPNTHTRHPDDDSLARVSVISKKSFRKALQFL